MIRFFLLILACMAGAWWLAEAIRDHGPGYVYLQFGAYTLETSAWFGFLLLAALVAALYVAARLASWGFYHLVMVGRLPRVFLAGRARKQHRTAVMAFLGEEWGNAAKKTGNTSEQSETERSKVVSLLDRKKQK